MKKFIVLAALSLAAAPAFADTITLGVEDCGATKQCINVPNDKGADVDLYLGPQYPFLNVYIAGKRFYSPVGNGVTISPTVLTATDGSGATITFSAAFSTYRTCTHSGRGQTCETHYGLTSGSIVQ